MTEELRQALDLYKIWVDKFHFHQELTQEDWYRLQTRENLSEEAIRLVEEWDAAYSNPVAALNRAHNYIYTLIEEGRESELPEDIRELINQWNNH